MGMEGLESSTEQAPGFQRSDLMNEQMKLYNLLDSILQPKYHNFSQNYSWLHPSIAPQDRSNGTQYTPPNKLKCSEDYRSWTYSNQVYFHLPAF